MTLFHSYLWLNSIPLYIYIHICIYTHTYIHTTSLSIHLSMDISMSWLLHGDVCTFSESFWSLHEMIEKDLALFVTFSRHSRNSISHPSLSPLSNVSVLAQNPDEDPDARKDWRQEKGMTEDKMIGWHHQINEHKFEQTLGDGEGQGSLACCSP